MNPNFVCKKCFAGFVSFDLVIEHFCQVHKEDNIQYKRLTLDHISGEKGYQSKTIELLPTCIKNKYNIDIDNEKLIPKESFENYSPPLKTQRVSADSYVETVPKGLQQRVNQLLR